MANVDRFDERKEDSPRTPRTTPRKSKDHHRDQSPQSSEYYLIKNSLLRALSAPTVRPSFQRLERFERLERLEHAPVRWRFCGEISDFPFITKTRNIFGAEASMKNQNESRTRNSWIDFCLILLFIGVAVTVLLSSVSETTKLLLLGSGFLVAAVWGRKKLRQE